MKHYAFLIPSILSFALLAACGDDDSSFAPRDTDDSSSSICDDCDDESSSSEKGTTTNSSDSRDGNSSSSGDLSKYDFVWDTFAEAFNTTCDASREGQVGLARYAENSELVCTHDEYLDKWGWLSPSSSSEASSSSAAYVEDYYKLPRAEACQTESEDNCEYGELTDERDDKTYKTVKIGDQEWMADDLKYEDKDKYTWEEAMSACPAGWHLPSFFELEKLIATTTGGSAFTNNASYVLELRPFMNRGHNDYGFSAYTGSYWSSTRATPSDEPTDDNAYIINFDNIGADAYIWDRPKTYTYYVRCVKGEIDTSKEPAYSRKYGTLTDDRDGQTYKTVEIGTQTWMAENLNIETPNSKCAGDLPENCEKYGRLYLWSEALDSAGTWSDGADGCGYRMSTCRLTSPLRGSCPEGWHLPTAFEFDTLFAAVGGIEKAGRVLKATEGWADDGNGTDAFGFGALPAGYYDEDIGTAIGNLGFGTGFWTASMHDDYSYAFRMYLVHGADDAGLNFYRRYNWLSVRCVKD